METSRSLSSLYLSPTRERSSSYWATYWSRFDCDSNLSAHSHLTITEKALVHQWRPLECPGARTMHILKRLAMLISYSVAMVFARIASPWAALGGSWWRTSNLPEQSASRRWMRPIFLSKLSWTERIGTSSAERFYCVFKKLDAGLCFFYICTYFFLVFTFSVHKYQNWWCPALRHKPLFDFVPGHRRVPLHAFPNFNPFFSSLF